MISTFKEVMANLSTGLIRIMDTRSAAPEQVERKAARHKLITILIPYFLLLLFEWMIRSNLRLLPKMI